MVLADPGNFISENSVPMTTLTPGNPTWYEGSRAFCRVCNGEYQLDANDPGKDYMIMSEDAVQAGCPLCGAIITFWRAPSAPEQQAMREEIKQVPPRDPRIGPQGQRIYTPEEQETAYDNYRKRNPI
jgi:hypothetical protein